MKQHTTNLLAIQLKFSNIDFTVKYSYLPDRGAQNVIILLFNLFISSVHHVSKTNDIFYYVLMENDGCN